MIMSLDNNKFAMYTVEVDRELLSSIQTELIDNYGSTETITKERQTREEITKLLNEKDNEIRNIISTTNKTAIIVPNSASGFEPVCDITYKVSMLPQLGIIIKNILSGDLSAVVKLRAELATKEEEIEHAKILAQRILAGDLSVIPELKPEKISEQDLLSYIKKIASCIKLKQVYSNDSRHYLEVFSIIKQNDEKGTMISLSSFFKESAKGNEIVETLNSINNIQFNTKKRQKQQTNI